jgi:hypothetical protein
VIERCTRAKGFDDSTVVQVVGEDWLKGIREGHSVSGVWKGIGGLGWKYLWIRLRRGWIAAGVLIRGWLFLLVGLSVR